MAVHPLVPDFADVAVPMGEVLDRQVELLRAAHGRPDLSVTEPVFGATARGAARHLGHAEIAALL